MSLQEIVRAPTTLDRISVELTNRCSKACWFCYNHSAPTGGTEWTADELVDFAMDCAAHEVKAMSFGGGEPLQFGGLCDVLARLEGILFRSLTTNGLLLDAFMIDKLKAARPDKVHVSIHFPGSSSEVKRVIRNVRELADAGIRSGVNLLVPRSQLNDACKAARLLRESGITNDRIVYLPMRGSDTPTQQELARVAGDQPFQSMTCLPKCASSPRFCSISWDRRVAWCSYTTTRRLLSDLTYEGLVAALDGLGLEFCGGSPEQRLVQLHTSSPSRVETSSPSREETDQQRVETTTGADLIDEFPHRRDDPFLKRLAESRGFSVESADDFPAAHSGDVEWFAVDAEGRLAYFNPWNSAPVPEAFDDRELRTALAGPEPVWASAMSERLSALLNNAGIRSELMLDLEGAFSVFGHFSANDLLGADVIGSSQPAVFGSGGSVRETRRTSLGEVTVIVKSLELVQESIDSGLARLAPQRPAPPPYVVHFRNMPRPLAIRILNSGECLTCVTTENDENFLPGVFFYHDSDPEHGLQGPYFRTTLPTNPLKIDQLPQGLQDKLKQVAFDDLSFVETPFLQPLDHMPCSRGWSTYVDTNGVTVRAAPGYAPSDIAQQLQQYQRGWDDTVAGIERERNDNLAAMKSGQVATASRSLETWDSPCSGWLETLRLQLGQFRSTHTADIVPDSVRVALTFPDETVALDAYRELLPIEGYSGRPFLRRNTLRLLDADHETQRPTHTTLYSHSRRVWDGLNEQIRRGGIPEPKLAFERPQIGPGGEAWKSLWVELTPLRIRQAKILAGHIPTRAERRQLERASQAEVWEVLIALLLSSIGEDFEFMTDYYCLLDYESYRSKPIQRLSQLSYALSDVTLEQWQVLESILSFFPVAALYHCERPPLQELRLRALSSLARNGLLNTDDLADTLEFVVEGRLDSDNDELQTMAQALEFPGLPVHAIESTKRRLLVDLNYAKENWFDFDEQWASLANALRRS